MDTTSRRDRQRADRHRLIVDTARHLAETQGWDAVTTRRLAGEVGYSQPVLYSHFSGKAAIVGAVAIDGFLELTAALRAVRRPRVTRAGAVRAMAQTYLRFAADNPATYEAMFALPTDIVFGVTETPQPLKDAFTEISEIVAPFANGDLGSYAEVAWSALHGLVSLSSTDRFPSRFMTRRIRAFQYMITGPGSGGPAR